MFIASTNVDTALVFPSEEAIQPYSPVPSTEGTATSLPITATPNPTFSKFASPSASSTSGTSERSVNC